MKRAWTPSVMLLLVAFVTTAGSAIAANAGRIVPLGHASRLGCGGADVTAMSARLRGVEAVLAMLASEAQRPTAQSTFNAGTFDQGLGESIQQTIGTKGGLDAIVIGEIDRTTCEIETGEALASVPGVPASLGGSACLREAVSAGLSVHRKSCMAGRNPANEGTDYWEGRRMSEVIRELTDAYSAEAKFLRDQLSTTEPLRNSARRQPTRDRRSETDLCENCLHYIFDAERTLPVVGKIRMWADEVIPFNVNADGTITGWGTINTILDLSGSKCKVSGYNGAADFNINGTISGGNLNVILTPRGNSQRTSAAMTMTCEQGGIAGTLPHSQEYTISEQLRVPSAGEPFSEKRLDVGALTLGGMQGEIILKLFMKPRR